MKQETCLERVEEDPDMFEKRQRGKEVGKGVIGKFGKRVNEVYILLTTAHQEPLNTIT